MTTKGDSVRDERPDRTAPVSALSDVRTARGRRSATSARVGLGLFLSHRGRVLHAIWRELCSLRGRIAILRRNNWFRYGILLTVDAQGNHIRLSHSRKYLRARIRGIQTILSIHPGATLVDQYLYLQASPIPPPSPGECSDTGEISCESPNYGRALSSRSHDRRATGKDIEA